jgi:hypothetical protein
VRGWWLFRTLQWSEWGLKETASSSDGEERTREEQLTVDEEWSQIVLDCSE